MPSEKTAALSFRSQYIENWVRNKNCEIDQNQIYWCYDINTFGYGEYN